MGKTDLISADDFKTYYDILYGYIFTHKYTLHLCLDSDPSLFFMGDNGNPLECSMANTRWYLCRPVSERVVTQSWYKLAVNICKFIQDNRVALAVMTVSGIFHLRLNNIKLSSIKIIYAQSLNNSHYFYTDHVVFHKYTKTEKQATYSKEIFYNSSSKEPWSKWAQEVFKIK